MLVGGLVVTVAVVLVAMRLWPDNRSRAVPVDEVVRDYRASTGPEESGPVASSTRPPTDGTRPSRSSTTSATQPVAGDEPDDATTTSVPDALALPATGVYRYATNGREEVDALNGASHEYPAETTLTVIDDGCGVRLRWRALRERRDEWRLCSTDLGIELQPDAIQYHEFFQQPELEHLDCDRSVVVVPAGEPSVEPVVQSCHLEDDPWVATWSVIGRSNRSVAGADVAVWHVRMAVEDDDEHWEHTTIDWFFDDRGLPIAISSTKESNSPSPIGDVLYRERYELSAVSLTPLR